MKKTRPILPALVLATLIATGAAQARDVTHAMGVTTVPDAPQRVVILTNEGTEALLDLGVTPIAAVRSTVGEPWYPHIADALVEVTEIGAEDAPNLEAIAALEPDLILGIKVRHEGIYEQLSAMAPTVMADVFDGKWLENYQLYAEALGLEAEGEAGVKAFEERIAALKVALGDKVSEEISLVRFRGGGRTSLRAPDTFAGDILRRIGFARPAIQAALTDNQEITMERIPEMDGDRIFYFTRDSGDGEGLAVETEWTASPLWLGLGAVKAGAIHRVDDAVWNIAGGILAANLVLDDIAQAYGVEAPRQ
ncbi:ABC transporter substrate-binding protein [Devosia sp. LjRoot3]|uniref:ABC transporter substrate-binding protein n=1 Tax=Devosia sp. LjRoot3 TaxID=3342319 RepID=UPI003ED09AC3